MPHGRTFFFFCIPLASGPPAVPVRFERVLLCLCKLTLRLEAPKSFIYWSWVAGRLPFIACLLRLVLVLGTESWPLLALVGGSAQQTAAFSQARHGVLSGIEGN